MEVLPRASLVQRKGKVNPLWEKNSKNKIRMECPKAWKQMLQNCMCAPGDTKKNSCTIII